MKTKEIIIKLDKPTRASEVQMVFSKHFPFLKLEFFRKQHKALEGSPRKSMIKSDFELQLNEKTSITISDNMQVAELESLFMDKLNISAQVFRKSGRTWLETTFTDNWTLRKQNEEGLELSQF